MSLGLATALLGAAALKMEVLIGGHRPGTTWFTSTSFEVMVVLSELGLGFWLLSGQWPQWAARVSAVYFLGLAAVSGYLFATSAECCGCLGRLAIHPKFTFSFNIAALVACAWVRPPASSASWLIPPTARSMLAVTAFLGGTTFLLTSMPETRVAAWTPSEPLPEGDVVVLDPSAWTGTRWPLLDEIKTGTQLNTGRWKVVLIHADCSKCFDVIASLEARAGEAHLAVVEVPRASGFESTPFSLDRHILVDKLRPTRRWQATTPIVVELDDGVVTSVEASP
ncbi:MAG TPA: hypothetical protein PKD86_03830 [Gemmatales bacterium]|nr:hypothetical protein [Gemmatales bacterium]